MKKSRSEKFFERKFTIIAKEKFPDRIFMNNFPLYYSQDKTRGKREVPLYLCDLIEIDERGNFHLWEMKIFTSDQIHRGDVIGQLISYNFLFNTWRKLQNSEEFINDVFLNEGRKHGYKKEHIKKLLNPEKIKLKSWNIVACGGIGYEFAAGYNNIAWHLYSDFSYLDKNDGIHRNFWHFYETENGFDLRSIWELNALKPSFFSIDSNVFPIPHIRNEFDISSHENLHRRRKPCGLHLKAWEFIHGKKVEVK
ncbi:hypothetical protein [Yunchengibacter salinarum]|uniref:hypothetical protein n=1 Tax=Yunchengibacter salinarum TaxID=3133399 RepID=UPI0035B66516